MPIDNPDYVVKAVVDVDDVPEILAFYQKHGTKGVRKVSADEMKTLVESGLFYVARSTLDGSIVAATYLSEQQNESGQLEYEIGGGLVAKGHRDCNLAKCLGACAIAAQRLTIPREKDNAGMAPPIIGRVECSNKAPVREALIGLGFEMKRKRKIKGKPGLDEMPKDSDGNVCVEEFEFNDTNLSQRVKEVLGYREDGILTTGQVKKTVRIDVHALNANDFADPLRDLLDELGP
jgi:hypothetical protein